MVPALTPTRPSRVARALAVLSVLAVAATGCDGSGFAPGGDDAGDGAAASSQAPEAPKAEVTVNVKAGNKAVSVSKLLQVDAANGKLTTVTVTSTSGKAGKVPGRLNAEGTRWLATERLEPGTQYQLTAVAAGTDGAEVQSSTAFGTRNLSLDQQTYPSVAPLQGETVGVGMPVVVHFDLPVTDQVSFEKNMRVVSTPAQVGSWRWVSSTEAHWRPQSYWKPGTKVSVDVDVNGVPAGGGIFGQEDRKISFNVGKAHIYKVNAKTHQMKVFENGKLLRTLPITTGKAGFTTRSGVKVIMGKDASRRMNSETVGIARGSAEAYDIANVKWAMRVTNSGEFIHAAPWSVGSQGHANVSHGCTGLSTADAGWLYDMSRRGDVVQYVGTDRPMEPDNGYGDWNLDWPDYVAGSALS